MKPSAQRGTEELALSCHPSLMEITKKTSALNFRADVLLFLGIYRLLRGNFSIFDIIPVSVLKIAVFFLQFCNRSSAFALKYPVS